MSKGIIVKIVEEKPGYIKYKMTNGISKSGKQLYRYPIQLK